MKSHDQIREELMSIYGLLRSHFGFLDWWPGDTPFEVMVGAILTQNTAWTNVEKAIAALKSEDALSPETLARMDIRKLRRLIRPSGYFNQKAVKLKDLVRFFQAEPYFGDLKRLAQEDAASLREKLLAVRGIGPETADSILLYALDQLVFVVDAYTRRIFSRLGYLGPDPDYHETQAFFVTHLHPELELYNDFHAQIVYLGKDFCRKQPKCGGCPLEPLKQCRVIPAPEPRKSSGPGKRSAR